MSMFAATYYWYPKIKGKFLSEKLNFPAADLSRSKIAKQTFDALPKKIAENCCRPSIRLTDYWPVEPGRCLGSR